MFTILINTRGVKMQVYDILPLSILRGQLATVAGRLSEIPSQMEHCPPKTDTTVRIVMHNHHIPRYTGPKQMMTCMRYHRSSLYRGVVI
jgi:hypothetical protein